MKLTKLQEQRLQEIADFCPTDRWPHAAYWEDSRTDQSLIKRGLVERVEHVTRLGGTGGTVGLMAAIWHLCRLTPAGREALRTARRGR